MEGINAAPFIGKIFFQAKCILAARPCSHLVKFKKCVAGWRKE
jgi:hypothetical protein